jgi:ABC-type branched-subunit amino acid transport system substrate-binding protein
VDGTSPRGSEIEAFVGESRTPLPGRAATCASCHGRDGRGRPEAGVIPSDVTWSHLTTPYGHVDHMGRKHGPFTRQSLGESIVTGRDPAGNDLDTSMPVYRMTDADLADLVAYMVELELDLDPGLRGDAVRIGTVLPTKGRMALIGQAILEVLAAHFDASNAAGGINGRRIELVEVPYDNAQESPLAAARRLVEEGDVFALVSPFVAGADAEIAELAERAGIPVIGPFTLLSPDPLAISDFTFLVYGGLREQLRALVDFAADELGSEGPQIAVVGVDDERSRGLASAVADQCRAKGWEQEVRFVASGLAPAESVAGLRREGVDALFLLDAATARAWIEAAGASDWSPDVFLPGPLAGRDVLAPYASFRGRIHLAYPTVPSDQTPAAVSELEALLASRGFPLRHRAAQVFAVVAARVLEEGLKAAGRDLSREKLLRALEKLDGFRTGLAPPLHYGANRRIGALGAYVVAADPATGRIASASTWMELR